MLWGIYSVVYIGTLYLYVCKNPSRRWFIIGGISLSYFAFTVSTIMFWYLGQIAIINSETREDLVFALELGSQWPTFVNDVVTFTMAAVADGILIWRCFHVWGDSFRVVIVPTFLFLCEILLDLAILILLCAEHLEPPDSQANRLDQLIGTQAFLTFVTTLLTTLLIAYRIYTTSTWEQEQSDGSRKRIKQILEILTESAVVYSLAAFAQAVIFVIPSNPGNFIPLIAAQDFVGVSFIFISGAAPAAVVARVALLNDREKQLLEDRTRVSGLQFHMTRNSTAQETSQAAMSGSQLGIRGMDAVDGEFKTA